MDNKPKSRQRGVILTATGEQKLQSARIGAEIKDNNGDRYTLEELSDRTGLSVKTISKVLDSGSPVDKPTLETFFAAFGLLLERQDYRYRSDEPEAEVGKGSVVDWGEAPDIAMFYGREEELVRLEEWIAPETGEQKRLIGILGMGGIGKTSLVTKLLHRVLESSSGKAFDYVIWRSLRNAPTREMIVEQWIGLLSQNTEIKPDFSRLIYYLHKYRCLLVLDNLETILNGLSGDYRSGYENFGELLNLIGETPHQSTLIITSREKTIELNTLAGDNLPVSCLSVKGSPEASIYLMETRGLKGTFAEKQQLCHRYSNNPLAIKVMAATIGELFDGDIAGFLREQTIVFPGIRRLLEQQFDRLSPEEQALMFWLAINREPVSLQELNKDLALPRAKILVAIENLHWRSSIEKNGALYTQQPLVMEYVTERLTEGISRELLNMLSTPPSLLHRYAILKTTAPDYIRESQTRLIVAAIVEELVACFGSPSAIAEHLRSCLSVLRLEGGLQCGYAAGNILNLLCHLEIDLTGWDFSGLAIWQAYLPNIPLVRTNFNRTDWKNSKLSHTFGAVFSVDFRGDGEYFASGELSGYLRLWRVRDGENLWAVKTCDSWIRSVAFSGDGKLIAVGSGDHSLQLWDFSRGELVGSLRGHSDQVHCVAFHPLDRLLASGGGDRSLRLWDRYTGKCLQVFCGHTDQVQSLCFTPDGDYLISGGSDRSIKLWDVKTGDLVRTFTGHEDQIYAVQVHPSGKLLASGSADGTIKLWTLDGALLQTLTGHTGHIYSLRWSPDGSRLASSGTDRIICLWDRETGQLLRILSGHNNWVRGVDFSPDGRTLLSGGSDYCLKLWEVETGQLLRSWSGYSNWIWSARFSGDSRTIVSGGGDQNVRVWDSLTGQCLRTMRGHRNWILATAVDHDCSVVASGGGDNSIILWQPDRGRVLKTLTGHDSQVLCLQFGREGKILASSSSDYSIRLWSVPDGKPLGLLQGHQDWIRAIAFRADGKLLASAGQDGTVKVWDVDTGRCVLSLEDFDTWVWGVTFLPDGKHLLSASGNRVKLWDLSSARILKTYESQSKWIRSIDVSPDGKCFVSGDQDHLVQLWDIVTGEILQSFRGHRDQVLSVAFSPDGRYIISGSADETIKLWHLATGELCKTLIPDRLYEEMSIREITGLNSETISLLVSLGAEL